MLDFARTVATSKSKHARMNPKFTFFFRICPKAPFGQVVLTCADENSTDLLKQILMGEVDRDPDNTPEVIMFAALRALGGAWARPTIFVKKNKNRIILGPRG